MRKHLVGIFLAVLVAAPVSLPAPAFAQRGQNYRWDGDRNDHRWDPARHYHAGRYKERRLSRRDRIYRGGDGRYYCRRSDGTTGLVVGAIAGGLLGNALGGDTLGTLLGAGGGALLGQSIDKGNVRCR
jgi:hypothetical protein